MSIWMEAYRVVMDAVNAITNAMTGAHTSSTTRADSMEQLALTVRRSADQLEGYGDLVADDVATMRQIAERYETGDRPAASQFAEDRKVVQAIAQKLYDRGRGEGPS